MLGLFQLKRDILIWRMGSDGTTSDQQQHVARDARQAAAAAKLPVGSFCVQINLYHWAPPTPRHFPPFNHQNTVAYQYGVLITLYISMIRSKPCTRYTNTPYDLPHHPAPVSAASPLRCSQYNQSRECEWWGKSENITWRGHSVGDAIRWMN